MKRQIECDSTLRGRLDASTRPFEELYQRPVEFFPRTADSVHGLGDNLKKGWVGDAERSDSICFGWGSHRISILARSGTVRPEQW